MSQLDSIWQALVSAWPYRQPRYRCNVSSTDVARIARLRGWINFDVREAA